MKNYLLLVLFIVVGRTGRSQGNPADIPTLLTQFAQSQADTHRVSICIQLAASFLAPGWSPNRMDSAAFYLKKAKALNDAFRIPTLQNRINLYAGLYHFVYASSEDPKTIFLPVIDTCRKTGDKRTEMLAWWELGYQTVEDPPSYPFKLTCFQNGLDLARQTGDRFMALLMAEEIGHVHALQDKFPQAEQELRQVLQEAPKVSPILVMYTYNGLTHLSISKGESAKALRYALKAQELMGSTGDSAFADEFFDRIELIYLTLGRESDRHLWAKKQFDFDLSADNIPGVYTNIASICRLMLVDDNAAGTMGFIQKKLARQKPNGIVDQKKLQEALGDIYSYQKRYDMAEKCYLEMIRLGNLETHNFPIWERAWNNYRMGEFYCGLGQYRKANPFLETALSSYEAYSVLPYRRNALRLLFRTDSALGNYVQAIQYLKEFDRIGDSIFKVDRTRQIEQLQIAYKTVQKDDSIGVLQGKELVAQLQLQHTQAKQNWIIAAAAMFLIIAVLLSRLAIIRKRNNRIVTGKNTQLQHLVEEKDWLMKEIHHRVKNNFQTVMGLLGTQTDYLQNDVAITAITDSQRRIQSMSLIHQKLYQSNNLSTVSLKSYIHELVDFLRTSFNTGKTVRFDLDLDPVQLDLAHCIPLGLILNEAITNAFKYAFPNQRPGTITISLTNTTEGRILLTIKDDGVGFPQDFDAHRANSMGMNLINGLCEQIGAQFSISGENGTRIDIDFRFEAVPATKTQHYELINR